MKKEEIRFMLTVQFMAIILLTFSFGFSLVYGEILNNSYIKEIEKLTTKVEKLEELVSTNESENNDNIITFSDKKNSGSVNNGSDKFSNIADGDSVLSSETNKGLDGEENNNDKHILSINTNTSNNVGDKIGRAHV